MKRGLILIAAITICLLLTMPLFAQLTARGLGMGGAYTALARGVHAVDWNPANLGLPDNPRFSMTIIGVGAGVSNNSFSKSMYDKYLVDHDGVDDGHIHWSANDVNDIFAAIPSDGLKIVNDIHLRLLSFSVGNLAISIGAISGTSIVLEKDIFRIPLMGTKINETYNLGAESGQGLGYGMLDISYGRMVYQSPHYTVAVGASAHFLYGAGYAQSDEGEAVIALNPYGADITGSYEATYAYNGSGLGWGIDLGGVVQFGDGWTVSMALGNILGSIPFNGDVEKEFGDLNGDSLSVLSDFDEDMVDSTWSAEGEALRVPLPRQLRLGVSLKQGPFLFSGEIQQGFSDGAMVTKSTRLAIGTEWRGLSWLPLRVGISTGGRYGFSTAFGFGIRPGGFVLDLAVLNRGGITPASSKGVSVALELGIDLAPKKNAW
ncbi:hypothetical protein KAR48_18610 [bacterium]|nr:hypothetical protein [bacterium]